MKTNNWREFKVGDLFELERGKCSKVVGLLDGSIPYVGCTNRNNGVMAYYDVPDEMMTKGNCICFIGNGNGSAGKQIFKKEDFLSSTGNVCGRTSSLNYYSANFIIAIMDKQQDLTNEFSHKNGRTLEKLSKQSLLLPATPAGSPDWAYMENYMKEMEEKAKERLDRLEEMRKQEKKKIDVSGWGEFKVGELFDVSISKSIDKTYLNFIDDGEIEYIGRTAVNNGIQGKMNVLDNIIPNQHNVFSLAQIGDNVCLFRETPWYSSQNIFILHPKYKKIIAVEKFVSTVITKTMLSVYGCDAYASYPTLKTLKDVTLLLPVTSAGDPDWDYMEQYMSKMEEKARERLEKLGK